YVHSSVSPSACAAPSGGLPCPCTPKRTGDHLSEQDSNPPVSTGGGDDGATTLLGSGRIGKDDPRIIVLGDVDEASSFLRLARAAGRTLAAAGSETDHHHAVRVVNRLSDLLFVLARNADGEKTLSKG